MVMKRIVKRGLSFVIVLVLFLTTVYAGNALISSNKKTDEDSVDSLLEKYLLEYGDNLIYGTWLYVWSGDKDFDPQKDFHPTGTLESGDKVEFDSGKIDLTPGATSPVIYKITDKEGDILYKLYPVTAVSTRSSATVKSEAQEDILWGVKKSEGYSGDVPADYTLNETEYEADKELTIQKGSTYEPRYSFVNYDPKKFVVDLQKTNLNTDKTGTYQITYNVSPVNDFKNRWTETYNVHVVDEESENKGMKVVATDTALHATILDENSCESEVFMGNDYNLNAGVKEITVHIPSRNDKAYADVKVFKNGKSVNKNEIIKKESTVDGNYIIEFKNYDYEGYMVELSNENYLKTVKSVGDKYVVGGWDNHEGIEVDKEPEESGVKSFIMSLGEKFSTDVLAAPPAGKVVKDMTLGTDVLNGNPTPCGWTTGVVDAVYVNYKRNRLINRIEDFIEDYGLTISDESKVPGSIWAGCIDEGKWGYNSMYTSYVTTTIKLYKNGNDYNVYVSSLFYKGNAQYQRLSGGVPIPVESENCSVKVTKTTDNNNNGVVKGVKFGVYTSEKNAKNNKNKLFTLEIKTSEGIVKATKKQAAQLKAGKPYWIKEIYAPKGTSLNSNIKSFTTKAGKTSNVSFTNNSWWFKLSVEKRIKDTNTKLANAEFTLYEWSSKNGQYKVAKDKGNNGKFTTGSDGKFTTTNKETEKLYYTKDNLGKWKLTETKPPNGYSGSASKIFTINNSNNKNNISTKDWIWPVDNSPITAKPGKISVQKRVENVIDGTKKDVSADHNLTATFNVYSDSDCKNFVTSITTNDKGYGISCNLPVDRIIKQKNYWVKEIKCSEGVDIAYKNAQYVSVNEDEISVLNFNINKDALNNTNRLGVQNEWDIGIRAIKIDQVTQKPLANAEFTFYEWNGKDYVPIKDKNDNDLIRTSDKNGYATVTSAEGYIRWTNKNQGRFAVCETKAPEGYTITEPLKKTTIINSTNKFTTVDITFMDVQYGKFEFQKEIIDLIGNKISNSYDFTSPSLGIKYTLYYANENGTKGKKVAGYDNMILDKAGMFKSGELPPGTYWLEESSLNVLLFSNKPGAKFKFNVNSGITTKISGSKGVSYDNGETWSKEIFGH